MSIKLSLSKRVVLSIRVDQHSRGVHFGSIGYLLHEEKKLHSITKRQGKLLTKVLLHLSGQTPTFSAKLIFPALTNITLPFMLTSMSRSWLK